MNDRTVTELVIDSDTSGVQAYEQAMASAERAARGGVDASNSYVTAIAGVSTAAVAVSLAIKAAMEQIAGYNKQLADLQLNARQAGLSLADLQGVQFGARKEGLTDQQIAAGLEKSAQLLNDAQRNANSLSKEFEANGLSIRRANGQLITQNQLLQVAADLVKRAQTPQDQIAIAQMLGFTKEWVPFLEQGAGAMRELTDEARRAGAVIDDETVNKAAEFDREWRKSSVELEFQLKAALLGLLPYVDDLITRLSKFVRSIDVAKAAAGVQAHADTVLDQGAAAAGLPKSAGLKLEITPAAEQAMRDWQDSSKPWLDRFAAIVTGLREVVQYIPEQDVKWHGGTGVSVPDTSGWMNEGQWQAQAQSWKALSASFLAGADQISTGFSRVAARSADASDAVDRALNSLRRHIETQRADAAALGLGEAAQARFRVEAARTSAIQANGGKITAAQAKEFERLKTEAEDVADAYARLKAASQIEFAQKTMFLSPQDLAIAQQLRGIYGNDVPAALASTEAAQLRVIANLKEMRDVGVDFVKSFVQGLMQGKSGMDALTGAVQSLGAKMAEKAVNDLFSGNYVQAGIEAVVAVGSALFTGNQKARQELEEAQRQWAGMTRQVSAFNQAAAGVDLGPLTQEVQSLYQTSRDLGEKALKAKDYAAVNNIGMTYERALQRIIEELGNGDALLSPLQKTIKGVKDEAAGLQAFLNETGYGSYGSLVADAASQRIAQLIAKYRDDVTTGLAERLNAAGDKDYLNDAARLIKQHQADLVDAADLGNDPAMLAQIASVFQAEAQKIIQDAGLVGDEFAEFTKLFPDLAGAVHEATVDITGSIKAIRQYLESLNLSDSSILSPQDQLDLAQANFQRQLALAQGGDADALSSITQYAQGFLDQAKGFYASSAGYADIFRNVTAALGGLAGIGNGGDALVNAPLAGPTSSLPGAVAVATPSVSSAANDNGERLVEQTDRLVQAMLQTSQAEIVALQNGVDVLAGKLDRLAVAIDGNRGRAMRPADRVA